MVGIMLVIATAAAALSGAALRTDDRPGARDLDGTVSRLEFEHDAMGTRFRIVVVAADEAAAARAAGRAFERIDDLDARLSDYRFESDVRRLERAPVGRPVPVSADLWSVLSEAQVIARETDGAFDVTVGALTRLWRWASRRRVEPPDDRLAAARRAVGYRFLELDDARRSVTIRREGVRLDLGGIAKGYAVDEAFETLREAGLRSVLVDGGGDLRLGAAPPGTDGWRIAVPAAHAEAESSTAWTTRQLSDIAIATSGARYRSSGPEGRSHVLDPTRGTGIRGDRVVSVMAPTASRADALASALSVLGASGLETAHALGAVEASVFDRTPDRRESR